MVTNFTMVLEYAHVCVLEHSTRIPMKMRPRDGSRLVRGAVLRVVLALVLELVVQCWCCWFSPNVQCCVLCGCPPTVCLLPGRIISFVSLLRHASLLSVALAN
jgi:hypothetical protein